MKKAVIVQARATSTRLPHKVLLPLGSGTVLGEVLRRCTAIPGIDVVCCAVPEGEAHEKIATEALRAGALVSRGSEADVLDRYYQAARKTGASVVVRVTSDCPLIDPFLCGDVLSLVTEEVDYACNNLPPSFPHGLDCEAFSVAAFEISWRNATLPADREHVTPFLRREDGFRRAVLEGPGGAFVHRRWTLDHPQDYEMLKRTFELLPPGPEIQGWRSVAEILDAHPEIEAINSGQHQR